MQEQQLDELYLKVGFNRSESEQTVNIIDVASYAGFELPEDHKHFLLNYDDFDGFIGSAYLQIWNKNILEMNNLYGISHLLGIGSNGAGELIAIVPDSKKIVLCPFIDMDVSNHIEIGSSFSEMLFRLLDGIEWFT